MRLPDRIGRYRVQSVVGVGAFAVVVRAHDEVLDDAVAIKILADNWVRDDDVRARFMEEARLLRRIHSDHLVTVHDIGELDGAQPYFVMEFAKRGSLAERLAARHGATLDPASGRKIVDALADGLGALHRAGIVHRDVNPRNLFLQAHDDAEDTGARAARATQVRTGLVGAEERVLLGDLGLAKDVVRTGGAASLVGGTPHYQAPEQLDPAGRVRPTADVFAATGVLWEAITGAQPPAPAEVGGALTAVDGRWRPLFERGLAVDADERFEDMQTWREAVLACLEGRTAVAARPAVADTATLPYKGLASFQPEDAARFFGRDALVGELIRRLGLDRTLVVGGPSGSGKSSLVRAGVIPAVAAGALPGSDRWPVALFTPRDEPVTELTYQLEKAARSVTQQPVRTPGQLQIDPLQARFVAETITDLTGGLLIVIDQFEELFTLLGDRAKQQSFLDVLAAIVNPADSHVRLVIAMRADFYGASAMFPWLAERITRNQVLVGPMRRRELREAIEEPARQVGLQLEDGLVDAILDDGGGEPGALPLVSHALAETWRRRTDSTLTVAGYRQTGGVAGAIALTAEEMCQDLFDESQQRAARRLFLRLVTPGEGTSDTRRRLALSELDHYSEPAVMHEVAERLIEGRLLTVDRDTIEIAHEALIQRWPRLRGWIEESRDDLRRRQRIDRAGAEWVAQGREPDLLYRGTPLQSALEWAATHSESVSPAGLELLAASEAARAEERRHADEAARRARRLRRAAVTVLAVLTVVAIAASVLAVSAQREATTRLAQALATQAAEVAADDPRLSLALAAEAMARGRTASLEARAALVDGRLRLGAGPFAPAGAALRVGDVLTIAVGPDSAVVATGYRDGTVRLWDAATHQQVGAVLGGHAGAVEEIVFGPDGRWMVTAGQDGALLRWDVADPAAVPGAVPLRQAGAIMWGAAISPDGRTVASASEDGTVQLWDLRDARPIGEPLATLNRDMLSVAFAPDGDRLLAGTGDGEVWGWRLPDGEQIGDPIQAHGSNDVWDIVFDGAGETIATGGSDGRIRLWDAADLTLVDEPFADVAEDVRGPQFSPDGDLLLAGDEGGRVRAWSMGERALVPVPDAHHDAQVSDGALAADGALFATLGFDQTVRIWTRGGAALGTVLDGHEEGAFGVAVSADGALVATGDGSGAVRLFDTDTGRLVLGPLTDHRARVWALAFSPDGAALASGDDDGAIVVHDVTTGDRIAGPWSHGARVAVLRFHEERLLSGGDDGAVRVWDERGRPDGAPLEPHTGGVTDMVSGPDGALLVSARDGSLRWWDTGDRSLTRGPVAADDNTVWSLGLSADGALLATASADEAVTLWRGAASSRIADLTPHQAGATGVAFLADGRTLATSSRAGTVRLWDVALGRPVGAALSIDEGAVWRLSAHPLDNRFVTSSDDGTVRIWDVLDVEKACELAAGAFDEERRRQYLGTAAAVAECDT